MGGSSYFRVLFARAPVLGLHVEYAERRMKCDILFIFRPFYDYSNFEHEHVPV